ncbi:MAG: hypothetical protein ACD_58C00015G0002 [uncultured bacterium]|nr:MAG: hypothetical protein ACD_58C00015G0002 [uncultured bacterium]
MNILAKETIKLVEKVPRERLKVAKVFLQWLIEDEYLTQKEINKILVGEQEIKKGNTFKWREIARTV